MINLKKVFVAGILIVSARAGAQVAPQPGPQPGDGASIEALADALYATVTRQKGQPFDWPRLRALMLPSAQFINVAQPPTGTARALGTEEFIRLIDDSWRTVLGTERDQGFTEKQISFVKEQYGNIAMAFSTYEKGTLAPGAARARGINPIQFVRGAGRWWISSIAWDEEVSAGPLPPRFAGGGR